MVEHQYIKSQFDHYMYFWKLPNSTFIYLLLYVDNMLVASKSKVVIDKLKFLLSQEFDMKDIGEAKKILEIEIKRDKIKDTIWLIQSQFL